MNTLTNEKFQEIYTNEKFRNEVATAHRCCDSKGAFKYMCTCSYPTRYIVTEEMINEAKVERERASKESNKKNHNKLLFVAMGGTYSIGKTSNDDVGCHRIRTEFLNKHGERFFIEFIKGHSSDTPFYIPHSIRRTGGYDDINNYKNLQKRGTGKYTKETILNIVNSNFDCNFKELVIDTYNVSMDDNQDGIVCRSLVDKEII